MVDRIGLDSPSYVLTTVSSVRVLFQGWRTTRISVKLMQGADRHILNLDSLGPTSSRRPTRAGTRNAALEKDNSAKIGGYCVWDELKQYGDQGDVLHDFAESAQVDRRIPSIVLCIY
ncbi:hypothetical protein VTH82DRAFT_2514 [Thermothelomyces myriococcoides]